MPFPRLKMLMVKMPFRRLKTPSTMCRSQEAPPSHWLYNNKPASIEGYKKAIKSYKLERLNPRRARDAEKVQETELSEEAPNHFERYTEKNGRADARLLRHRTQNFKMVNENSSLNACVEKP